MEEQRLEHGHLTLQYPFPHCRATHDTQHHEFAELKLVSAEDGTQEKVRSLSGVKHLGGLEVPPSFAFPNYYNKKIYV